MAVATPARPGPVPRGARPGRDRRAGHHHRGVLLHLGQRRGDAVVPGTAGDGLVGRGRPVQAAIGRRRGPRHPLGQCLERSAVAERGPGQPGDAVQGRPDLGRVRSQSLCAADLGRREYLEDDLVHDDRHWRYPVHQRDRIGSLCAAQRHPTQFRLRVQPLGVPGLRQHRHPATDRSDHSPNQSRETPGSWKDVWSESFDGAAGTAPSATNWQVRTGTQYPGGAAHWVPARSRPRPPTGGTSRWTATDACRSRP